MFPPRTPGRIFNNQVQRSGSIRRLPAVWTLGGRRAYIPAFCMVFMVGATPSMYLLPPWPRCHRREDDVEEWRARMHCEVSGCGDCLRQDRGGCSRKLPRLPSYLPACAEGSPAPPLAGAASAPRPDRKRIDDILPRPQPGFDVVQVIGPWSTPEAFSSAEAVRRELVTGFASAGRAGRLASSPRSQVEGACSSSTGADKAARFIWLVRRVQSAAAVFG